MSIDIVCLNTKYRYDNPRGRPLRNDLFCQSRKCYTPAEGCVCKLCNSPADHKSHIIQDEPFEQNVSNINIITKDVAVYEHNL